jgi:hypothetical protein
LDTSGGGAGGRDSGGRDASGDEAAWRDLIARYDQPADLDLVSPPWPERENLGRGRHERPQPASGDSGGGAAADPEGAAGPGAGDPDPEDTAPEQDDGPAAQPDDPALEDSAAEPATARPSRENTAGGAESPGAETTGMESTLDSPPRSRPAGGGSVTGRVRQRGAHGAGPAGSRARIIRSATAPPPRVPAEDADLDDDDHFIPPPPGPLPQLDPITKGAWLGLLGGPGYLLVASVTGWVVPGWAALLAVSAFVAGFTVIVIRLGDGSNRGSGPDSGAVV